MIIIFLTINRWRCVTSVLLDTLSTKHDHRWIRTFWTHSCVCGIGAADIEVPIFNTYQWLSTDWWSL